MPGRKAAPPSPSASPKSPKGKGKQRATSASSPSSRDSPASKRAKMAPPASEDAQEDADDNEMLTLAERIADNAHLLARGRGSDDLAAQAREVVKRYFDRALESEALSFPHLSTLLASLTPTAGPSTRSASAARADAQQDAPRATLEVTPITELTTDGMDPEMIWEQMELRGRTVANLMESMFAEEAEPEDEEGGEFDFDEDEEAGMEGEDASMFGEEEGGSEEDEGSDAESAGGATPEEEEYYRRLGQGKEEGLDSDDVAFDALKGMDEEEEDRAEGSDAEEGAKDPMADSTRDLNLDNFDGEQGKRARSRRPSGPASAVDDDFFSLHDFHVDADEGEFEMERMLKGEIDDFEEEDGAGDGIDLFAPVDESDEDEEEEEGDLDIGGLMYKDFFDPPNRRPKKAAPKPPSKPAAKAAADAAPADAAEKAAKKRGVRFSESVKVKEIPHRLADRRAGAGASAGEDEEDDDEEDDGEDEDEMMGGSGDDFADLMEGLGEDEEMLEREGSDLELEDGDEEMEQGDGASVSGSEDDVAEGQETIERFKTSLFDDEEDEEADKKNLTRHERRLLQLSAQIASLEAENVGPKQWATRGEAQSRDRPMDSLLEEDLEFERMGKVAPSITEETTKTIEDLIKKRILDNQFDDVERRRPVDPNAFLPSRYMELQDSKSQKSLAEVYEDEFRDAREREQGREVVHELDKDLQKKHDEIEALFEDLAARLDALSNARFTPKAPKATITTVSNLPSISLESALPTTNSTSTLLAPEEVYSASGPSSALAVDKADLTPAQKKAQRQKEREQRKGQHEKAARILEAKQRRKGVKGEKERAEQILLGTKGVTVIGKNGAEKAKAGKKRKRGEDGMGKGEPSGVALKL
ncbi:hypothetical protein JCM10213_007489 [Rhodosporidiobolus nylandii]